MDRVEDFRNIAFIGHGDAGKTSLVEAMLYKAGATTRLGDVAEGSTVCDYEPDEKERKNSIDCGLVYCNWPKGGAVLNIIDTPGYPDFIGQAISGLSAVDTAFLAINAASGIMVNTRKMWDYAGRLGVVRAIAITKLDMANIKLDELLQSIQEAFGDRCIPVMLPNATGGGLTGVTNLLSKTDKPSPESKQWHEKLVEAVVEVNDELMNKYLDGKEITEPEFESALKQALVQGKLTPVVCTSYKKQIGIEETLNFIVKYLPSPNDRGARTAHNPSSAKEGSGAVEVKVTPDAAGPFAAYVFKTISDPFVGKLSYLRIYSGALAADSSLHNVRTGKTERFGKIFKMFGKEQRSIPKAITGDIIMIPKLEELALADTVCDSAKPVRFPEIQFPQPMVSLALEPKSKGDEQRMSISLTKMTVSDPTFKVSRDRQTGELVISGMSNLHIDIILRRLKDKFGVEVITKQPKIPYRETITMPAEGHHKHKKQTGGRGQYGEVYLKIEPLQRGSGFEFVNDIFGGSIPNQYVPAVEKGVKEVMDRGVIAGYPVVDVRASVYDGSYHEVDSSEASFKIAGSKAFQAGFKNAKPMLLEPIVNIEVTIPTKHMGDITGDLNSRRGRITGMDTIGGQQVIKATVPLAEVITYSTELRSITAGEGHYAIEFSHYDIVPHKTQEAIIARNKPKEETEED